MIRCRRHRERDEAKYAADVETPMTSWELRQFVAAEIASGEGTPAYRAWLRRQAERLGIDVTPDTRSEARRAA